MNIKFHSLQQWRKFTEAMEFMEYDGKVTIEQRTVSGSIVLGNRTTEHEIAVDGTVSHGN